MIPFCLEMTFDPNVSKNEWHHALTTTPDGWHVQRVAQPDQEVGSHAETCYVPTHENGDRLPVRSSTYDLAHQALMAWFEVDRAQKAVDLALMEDAPLSYTREQYEAACLAADVPALSELQVAQHYQSDRAFPIADYPAPVVISARLAHVRARGLFAELGRAQRSARDRVDAELENNPLSRAEYERGCEIAGVEALPDAEAADIGAWHHTRTENVRSIRTRLAEQRYRGVVAERPERCCVVCGQWQPPIVGRSVPRGVVCLEHVDIVLDG